MGMARLYAWMAAPGLGIILAASFVGTRAARAADSPPAAVTATIQLRDGRVFHNVRILADEGKSIVIRADEGLIEVEKTLLPQAMAVAYPAPIEAPVNDNMVMVPFNPNPPDEEPPREPGAKPKPAPANASKPVQNSPLEFRGCTIVSFQMKSFQSSLGCAEVVVSNGTENPVVIFPRNFICQTASGERHQGRFIVTDGFPPMIKRREVVPPQGTIDDIVTFTNDVLAISSVQWAR
jgi:hypothetical protein